MKFEKAIELVIKHEGGWVDDPDDTGGRTKYGISQAAFPNEDIKNMTKERAIQLYHDHYWSKMKCDELPDGVDYLVLDCGINMGNRTAIKILQRAAGVTADGIIGPKTIAASSSVSPELFMVYRLDRYMRIIGERHSNAKFARGWSNRCLDVLKTVS